MGNYATANNSEQAPTILKILTKLHRKVSVIFKITKIMSNGVNLETNGVNYDDAQGEDGFKRRNSLERYRPGAYFNEEREKLRRRAHFGERRLDIDKANGHRGRGGRGGQR